MSSNLTSSRVDNKEMEIQSPPSIHHYHKQSEVSRHRQERVEGLLEEQRQREKTTLSPHTEFMDSAANLVSCEKDLEHLS